jgi:SagB-type dehydrogenase family enzyme
MTLRRAYLRDSELDRTSYPELRDRIVGFEQEPRAHETRSYPGYPRMALERSRPRPLAALERTLVGRRAVRRLGREAPSRKVLGRLLQYSHGVCSGEGRGPAPSSGGLQAVELYVAAFEPSWVPPGVHHYDRKGHHLSEVVKGADRSRWTNLVPSMGPVDGGALLWILVGDVERVEAKYGDRGGRFLLLEAGHVMQNLCLMSASLKLSTVPLGGALEPEIAQELRLPETDAVLYVALCGGLI